MRYVISSKPSQCGLYLKQACSERAGNIHSFQANVRRKSSSKFQVRFAGHYGRKSPNIVKLPTDQHETSYVWLPKTALSEILKNFSHGTVSSIIKSAQNLPHKMIRVSKNIPANLRTFREISSRVESKENPTVKQELPNTSETRQTYQKGTIEIAVNKQESSQDAAINNIPKQEIIETFDYAELAPKSRNNVTDTRLNFAARTLKQILLNGAPFRLVWPIQWASSNTRSVTVDANQSAQGGSVGLTTPVQTKLSSASIDSRTRYLVDAIKSATTIKSRLTRINQFCAHVQEYPRAKAVAVRSGVVSGLLKIKHNSSDKEVLEYTNLALALVGYISPVRGHGINVLCIDGGGLRGIVAIEVLRKLEEITKEPVHKLFDFMCGVSTGCIITLLLGTLKLSTKDCSALYKKIGTQIFTQSTLWGTSNLVLSHSYYDTANMEKQLRSVLGDKQMIDFSKDSEVPKIAAIASLMNLPDLQPFLLRNYDYPTHMYSKYKGTYKSELWEAVRASSAAPGYFEEYKMDDYILQDGGILVNNPSAVAIHECRQLWPGIPLQCMMSLGTGRITQTEKPFAYKQTSLKTKLLRVLDSATDTESIHTALYDLLPHNVYYRFNPHLSESITLDESRMEKLEQLENETRLYLRRNEEKINKVAAKLMVSRGSMQKLSDNIRLQMDKFL